MSGWISLQRDVRKHWIWEDPVKFHRWVDILMSANYQSGKVNIGMDLFECDRGQTIVSLSSWSRRWRVSKSTVHHFFKLLERDGMIKLENLKKTVRITICNYDDYQRAPNDDKTQRERRENETRTPAELNNKIDNINNLKKEEGREKIVCEILECYKINCNKLVPLERISDAVERVVWERFEEYGLEVIAEICKKAGENEFLAGKNKRGWKADLLWLMRKINFEKVLSGYYDRYTAKSNSGNPRKYRNDGSQHYDDKI